LREGEETRRKWIFRYPKEMRNQNFVEEAPRKGERKIGQMMTVFFYSQKYGCFLPVFPDSSSSRGRVTAQAIIEVYDQYDFEGIWEDIKQE